MKQILGIGNALCDILTQVDDSVLDELQLPKGSTQFVDLNGYRLLRHKLENLKTTLATGGSIGNTMLALSNLGASPKFIAKIGNDKYGDFYKNHMELRGCTPHFLVGELPTGVATTFITPDGQRTFDDYLGSAATLTPEDLHLSWFEGVDILYLEGYLVQNHDLLLQAVKIAKDLHITIALDVSSYNIVASEFKFFEKLLKSVDILFANEEEAFALTHKNNALEALSQLAQQCHTVIVKIGEQGAMAKQGENFGHIAALDVPKVVDTTGAGDFFAAGFLYGYIRNEDLTSCLWKGGILASKVIQVIGTTLSPDTWEEIKAKM